MTVEIDAEVLTRYVAGLLTVSGLEEGPAMRVAGGLVDADLMGVSSHGIMLAEMYLQRLEAGSVSTETAGVVVVDQQAMAVIDGRSAFGLLVADQAMDMAVEKARLYGVGVVSVRNAFHFGAARRFAVAAAEQGCVGLAMCNTRPLMPAPGGAERVVGNNPLAIAFPTAGEAPLVLDMATSEAAIGKIRMAAKAGRDIPAGWAVRADGSPTSDPGEALEGMLLPMAGPKGFGLALMIDLMAGVLSGGASGAAVQPLYGDVAVPYDCAHFFVAIDAAHFGDRASIEEQVETYATRIRDSRRAPGTERLFTPGERAWERRRSSRGRVAVAETVWNGLAEMATGLGVHPPKTAREKKDLS